MVPRPTNAGNYSRTTTQRPLTSTTALPVRISSFGNGTPETSNPIHRQKQLRHYSVGSRLLPLTLRVANESSPFGLDISHRTLLLPTSFRPFPSRQNNSAAPPLQRDRFPRSTSVSAPPLPPRRTCRIPHAVLHPYVLPQSRLAPVSANHLEKATALHLTVWLVLLSTKTLQPLPPLFHGYPGPNHPAYTRPPTLPPGQLFRSPTSVPWFPQTQQTHGLSLPTQPFSYPPINRILATNGPSAFLDDTTTDDPD